MSSLLRAHAAGELSKHDFITSMYTCHELLFSYVQRLADVNIKEISISAEGIVMEFSDPPVRMLCPQGDTRIAPIETLNFGDYEKAELQAVRRVISQVGAEKARCIDIGANVGFYSLAMASWFPGLQCDAFEPIPSTFATLKKNLSINNQDQVRAHDLGLSDKDGELVFYTYPSHSEAASMTRNLDSVDACEVRCSVRRLDDLDMTADFIKCDVEGAELSVFRGAEKLLSRDRPAVFTEMLRKWCSQYDYHPNDIIHLLDSHGYHCLAVSSAGLRRCPAVTEDTRETNYLFLHREKHSSLLTELTA